MESDRHFELYLAEFRKWATPAELGKLMRWGTPEDIAAILKAIGPPEEVIAMLVALRGRREAWEWNRRLWERIRTAATAAGLVGVVLGAIIAALTLAERLRVLWHG